MTASAFSCWPIFDNVTKFRVFAVCTCSALKSPISPQTCTTQLCGGSRGNQTQLVHGIHHALLQLLLLPLRRLSVRILRLSLLLFCAFVKLMECNYKSARFPYFSHVHLAHAHLRRQQGQQQQNHRSKQQNWDPSYKLSNPHPSSSRRLTASFCKPEAPGLAQNPGTA